MRALSKAYNRCNLADEARAVAHGLGRGIDPDALVLARLGLASLGLRGSMAWNLRAREGQGPWPARGTLDTAQRWLDANTQ